MNRSLKLLALAVFPALVFPVASQADVISAWNLTGIVGTPNTVDATTVDPNLGSPVTLSVGSGYLNQGTTFSSPNFAFYNTGATTTTFDEAKLANTYFEFTLTPNSGNQLNVDSIQAPYSISQNRDRTVYVASSLDGYASSLGSATIPTYLSNWGPINLGSAIQNQTSAVTMRLYIAGVGAYEAVGFGGGGSTGNDSLVVNGSVVVPEPGTMALLAFGSLAVLHRRRKNK